jgi:acyl carrier protein
MKPRDGAAAAGIAAFVLRRVQTRARLPENIDLARFDYIDAGLVDSIGMIRFVLDIETEFGIEVTEDDMISAQFRTIAGLVALIDQKCA